MSDELKTAVEIILKAGLQLSAEGLDYLKGLETGPLHRVVERAVRISGSESAGSFIVDADALRAAKDELFRDHKPTPPVTGKLSKRPPAGDYDAEIEVLDSERVQPDGSVEGFREYFLSRLRKLEKILRERMDVKDALTIGHALKMPLKSKLKVIGMVTRKTAKGEHLFLELEDAEDSLSVMASDAETINEGLTILEDQVICVEATKYRQDLLVASRFIWPDIPTRKPGRAESPLCAALLADLHVGSKLFTADLFDRFLRWMYGDLGPPESRSLAGRVKYVVVGGDLVDGIGIYPDQMKELSIVDVEEQYTAAASLLSKLPDYVEVIVVPGNHDAVRKSLPQPPLSSGYADHFLQDDRFHLLGNPTRISLSGVEALIYHGKALDDILGRTPGLDYGSPEKGAELLLRCRHFSPTYGASTPLAPERNDRLVITSVPDILLMGHVHRYGAKRYRGVNVLVSAPWQSQTSYQKRMSLTPTPGIAPIFDLQMNQVFPIDFNKLSG